MRLELLRFSFRKTCTLGLLYAEGMFVCFTMEPPEMYRGEINVPSKTCIPAGVYVVKVMQSPRHPEGALHILNVPGREAIEVHVGNTSFDTEGCVLVGLSLHEAYNCLGNSRRAFDIVTHLVASWPAGEIEIDHVGSHVALHGEEDPQ